eukprot:g27456.t1
MPSLRSRGIHWAKPQQKVWRALLTVLSCACCQCFVVTGLPRFPMAVPLLAPVALMPARCEAVVAPEVISISLGSIVLFIVLLLFGMVFGRNIAGFLDSLDNIEGSR